MSYSHDGNHKIDEDLKVGSVMLRYILFHVIMKGIKGRFKCRIKG